MKKFFAALLVSSFLLAGIPQAFADTAGEKAFKQFHKHLIETRKDFQKNKLSDAAKEISKAGSLLSAQNAGAEGRSRKMLRNTVAEFDRVLHDFDLLTDRRKRGIEEAFRHGKQALAMRYKIHERDIPALEKDAES